MKRLLLAFFWLFTTLIVALSGVALAYLQFSGHFLSTKFNIPGLKMFSTSQATTGTTTTTSGDPQIKTQPEVGDARVILVQNFLERHKSPILAEDPDFAVFLVGLADANNMDFRLLPAIAMQESNLCKVVPEESHNCLGLGVHKRGTWGFDTYRDNFTAAAQILKKNYIDIGLTTTEQIEKKYNPTSHNRDGSWASSVNQWMAEMRYDDRTLGKQLKTDANLLEFTEEPATESAELSSPGTKSVKLTPTILPTNQPTTAPIQNP